VSSVALAEDVSRQGLGIEPSPQPTIPTEAPDSPADVFIASSTNGGTFTDLSVYYGPAFVAAGAASTTAITDADASPFVFPVPFTAAEYGTLVVLSNENFWGPGNGGPHPENNVSLTDETTIAAYLDTGGTLFLSGQDYLWARGNGAGFPATRLGVASYTDDINFGDNSIAYGGVPGGAMDGLAGILSSAPNTAPCWAVTPNTFYTDQINPSQIGLMDYASFPSNVVGNDGTTYAAGAYRTVFATVEVACTTDQAQFYAAVASIYNYLVGGVTPVEPSSWGALKNRYKD
jgi:hypothetical protein